jgi:hypothetical protein
LLTFKHQEYEERSNVQMTDERIASPQYPWNVRSFIRYWIEVTFRRSQERQVRPLAVLKSTSSLPSITVLGFGTRSQNGI